MMIECFKLGLSRGTCPFFVWEFVFRVHFLETPTPLDFGGPDPLFGGSHFWGFFGGFLGSNGSMGFH